MKHLHLRERERERRRKRRKRRKGQREKGRKEGRKESRNKRVVCGGRGGQRIILGGVKSKPLIRMVTKIDLDLSFLKIKFSLLIY